MLLAMGGESSEGYETFLVLSFSAYNLLRKYASLLLAVLNGCCISVPSAAFVMDRLKLSMTDEEATRHLHGVIDESIAALFPAIYESMHRLAGSFRH